MSLLMAVKFIIRILANERAQTTIELVKTRTPFLPFFGLST